MEGIDICEELSVKVERGTLGRGEGTGKTTLSSRYLYESWRGSISVVGRGTFAHKAATPCQPKVLRLCSSRIRCDMGEGRGLE